MNYRHAFHAGNFADAHKHIALTAALLLLRKKENPFVVIDTHAGRGVYDLSASEAIRTSESAAGIGRLQSFVARSTALNTYLETVRSFGANTYPGSPLITAKLLRPQDRLIAIEKHREEFAMLANALKPYARARAIEADGYDRLLTFLPPPERRGLVLIDPPYEEADEFERLARTFAAAYRRFATGIYLLWFPLKLAPRVEALAGELRNAGAANLLALTLNVGRESATAEGNELSAAGLLVANAPYSFDADMRDVSAEILPHLRRGGGAGARVEWLSASH